MAIGHIDYNRQSEYGKQLKQATSDFETGLNALIEQRDTLIQMKDGANFTTYALTKYGFPSTAVADAALAEIESALAKVTVDTSVSGTKAALNQMLDKFR
jgi:hypothetical protein